MKFKEIPFADANAKRIYTNYLSRVRNSTKNLNKENQNDTLLEINSHIYEAVISTDKKELEALLDVLEKLGEPEVFLKELVAEKQLEEAAKSFNPVKIIKALFLNITNGVSYIVFLILYLSLFSFLFLIIAKIIDPEKIGFFYRDNDLFVLGKLSDSHLNPQQYEQLGNWFIPVMIVCAVIMFIIITLLLRLKKIIKKKTI